MSDTWTLVYDGFDPDEHGRREALTTLGNGLFATRGAAPEVRADDLHYPGTYVAGGYNRLTSEVAGKQITNEDLVNFPNWLCLDVRPEKGPWLGEILGTGAELGAIGEQAGGGGEILEHRLELRMREGLLHRRLRVRDAQGRITRIDSRRLVHMDHPHLAALEYRVTPENWSGRVRIRSLLDGSVENTGVARYRQLASRHLEVIDRGTVAPEGVYLTVRTVQSRIELAVAARIRLFRDGERLDTESRPVEETERIGEELVVELLAGEPVTVEKVIALRHSRQPALSEPAYDARREIAGAGDFTDLLASHRRAWEILWDRYDVELTAAAADGGSVEREQRIVRLHIFHLLQTVSPASERLDVGVPARGLHGEAYRGHIFWDELFILPFYFLRSPEIARALLLYRYNRLELARENARLQGFAGALFPWQSGSDGQEESQRLHLNPRSGHWDRDWSHLQRHINAAIAYNVCRYCQSTGDRQFLTTYGAEMLLEIARFFSSAAELDDERGRYVIRGVMGPDEYQEKYPGAETGGIDNNAYTNVMAVWCLERALEVLETVGATCRRELRFRLGIGDEELERWRDMLERMYVPFHADGVISQFEGYEALEELDWEGYRERYGSIERLDRILRAEGDTPDRYKASKQADATMLLFLLPHRELRRIFERLGYRFDEAMAERTIDYYRQRTSHGSTLSHVVFASVLHTVDEEEGWRLFCEALRSDIDDIQGGTTPEGIHLAAMAGTLDILMRRYLGVRVDRGQLVFKPALPRHRPGLATRLQHQGTWVTMELDGERLRLTLEEGGAEPFIVRVGDQEVELAAGAQRTIDLGGSTPRTPAR